MLETYAPHGAARDSPPPSCSTPPWASSPSRSASGCGSSPGATASAGYWCCLVYVPLDRYTQAVRQPDHRHPPRRLRRHRVRVLGPGRGVGAGPPALHRSHRPTAAGAEAPRPTSRWSRPASPRPPGRGPTTSPRRSSRAHGEERGLDLLRRYGGAFPAAYRDDFPARAAVADIARMESCARNGPRHRAEPGPAPGGGQGLLRFKLFAAARPAAAVRRDAPAGEHGRAGARPAPLRGADRPRPRLDPRLRPPARPMADLEADDVKGDLHRGLRRRLAGRGGERRVQPAGARRRPHRAGGGRPPGLQQVPPPGRARAFSQSYMERTPGRQPPHRPPAGGAVPRPLRPRPPARRRRRGQRPHQAARGGHRRRGQPRRGPHPALVPGPGAGDAADELVPRAPMRGSPVAFKLDPAQVPDLPLPRPRFEIFVCSPRVEGVHLRGGRVSRGGIRWSDRREDFRTEVLGLMKAQMVKNAVIVPVGAKGGFVVKRPPAAGDREALAAEVAACYRSFVSGPARRDRQHRRRRGRPPRPASSPTTATTPTSWWRPTRARPRSPTWPTRSPPSTGSGWATPSPPAGRRATTTRRWASPPRARGSRSSATSGSWASTPTPPRSPPSASATCRVTCSATACCCSRASSWWPPSTTATSSSTPTRIRRRSAAERQRLFRLPRSSWADYDPELISAGGGVFPRTAKLDPALRPRRRAALGVDAGSPPPRRAGQGRAAGAGRPALERRHRHLREGRDRDPRRRRRQGQRRRPGRRHRVAGPGGGGGRQPRLHPAGPDRVRPGRRAHQHRRHRQLRRGRLLRPRGQHQDPARHRRGRRRADRQAAGPAPGRDDRRGGGHGPARQLRPDRGAGHRPGPGRRRWSTSTPATSAGWRAKAVSTGPSSSCPPTRSWPSGARPGPGLTAPEFAVLLAYTKLDVSARLLASDVPEDPWLGRELAAYFPAPLRDERFASAMARHPLRREIIATRVTNRPRRPGRDQLRPPAERGDRRHRARAGPGPRRRLGDLRARGAVGRRRGARQPRARRHPDRA